MTVATTAPATAALNEQQLGLMFQYTVEAYKTFEKLALSVATVCAVLSLGGRAEAQNEEFQHVPPDIVLMRR